MRLLYKPTGHGPESASALSDMGVTRQLTRQGSLPGAIETLAQVLLHRLDAEHVAAGQTAGLRGVATHQPGGGRGADESSEVECEDACRCGAKD